MWSRSSVSSMLVIFPLIWPRCQSEGFVESLLLLTELSSGLPFRMGCSGLFFLFFESPWGFCIWVKVGGLYNCFSEQFVHGVFEGFYGSFVI